MGKGSYFPSIYKLEMTDKEEVPGGKMIAYSFSLWNSVVLKLDRRGNCEESVQEDR